MRIKEQQIMLIVLSLKKWNKISKKGDEKQKKDLTIRKIIKNKKWRSIKYLEENIWEIFGI